MELGFWATPKEVSKDKRLSFGARAVFGVLWTRKNGDNEAWPGQKYISESVCVSNRTTIKYLQELEKCGLIEIQRRGLRKTNKYILKPLSTAYFSLEVNTPSPQEVNTVSLPSIEERRSKISNTVDKPPKYNFTSMEQLTDSSKPHLRLIGFYFKEVQFKPDDIKHFNRAILRNMKPSSEIIKNYPPERAKKVIINMILSWIDGGSQQKFYPTLSTALKILDK